MSTLSQFYGGSGSKLPLGIKDTAFYIDALIVAGGGGNGISGFINAFGGAGGRVVQAFNLLVERNVTYNITVGGAGGLSANGGDSTFGSLISQGGGAGLASGGSGGGGNPIGRAVFPTVGTYSVNDVLNATNIISSGNDGGGVVSFSGSNFGGGGGAGSPGTNGGADISGVQGGSGGSGAISIIKGPGYFYGAGAGGRGIVNNGSNGTGFGGANTGSAGQSGVVIIAYPDTLPLATTTGDPILYTGGTATRTGYHVYEFLGSGTITFN
jgi:hypothetical protein